MTGGDVATARRAAALLLGPGRAWPDLTTPADYERAAWEALAVLIDACAPTDPDPTPLLCDDMTWPTWAAATGTYSTVATQVRVRHHRVRPLRWDDPT